METMTHFQEIVDTIRVPLIVLDGDIRVRTINEAFSEMFVENGEKVVGRVLYELGNGDWDIPALRELLENVLPNSSVFNNFEVENDFPKVGHKSFLLNARRLKNAADSSNSILLAFEEKR